LTSTLPIAIETGIRYFIFFAIHELVLGVVTLVSPQEVEVTLTSAVAAEFPCGAIHLLVTGVVVQALATPCGNMVALLKPLGYSACRGWWQSESLEETLQGSV